jgi:hypothetical protein
MGGIVGSCLVLSLDQQDIYRAVGILLLLIAPLGLLKKDFGLKNTTHSRFRKNLGYVLYFFIMIFAGFFGGGAGILVIFTLVTFLGLTALEAHATDILPWIFLTIASSAIFAWHGQIDYLLSATLFLSLTAGGWIGAHIAVKSGEKGIRIFVCLFAVLMGAKLLWDSF